MVHVVLEKPVKRKAATQSMSTSATLGDVFLTLEKNPHLEWPQDEEGLLVFFNAMQAHIKGEARTI